MSKHLDEKRVVTLGSRRFRFAVGPGAGEPPPPHESPTAKEYKRRLRHGDIVYGPWHNPDTFCGLPAYDVLRFHPDGRVFRAMRADAGDDESYDYTGEWAEEPYSPINIESSNFGRMGDIIKPAELGARLDECLRWNRQWWGLEKTDERGMG